MLPAKPYPIFCRQIRLRPIKNPDVKKCPFKTTPPETIGQNIQSGSTLADLPVKVSPLITFHCKTASCSVFFPFAAGRVWPRETSGKSPYGSRVWSVIGFSIPGVFPCRGKMARQCHGSVGTHCRTSKARLKEAMPTKWLMDCAGVAPARRKNITDLRLCA